MEEFSGDIRCPEHGFRLFAKVVKVKKDNCFEIKCRECSKAYTKRMKQDVEVFHYFNLLGFVETKIKPIKFIKKEEK